MENATILSGLIGMILSWSFDNFPVLRSQFDKLESSYKRIVVLATVAILTILLMYGGCQGYVEIECITTADWPMMVINVFVAFAASEAYHQTVNKS
jgi:hypothetical protein